MDARSVVAIGFFVAWAVSLFFLKEEDRNRVAGISLALGAAVAMVLGAIVYFTSDSPY